MKTVKIEAGEASKVSPPPGINRGISILDLVLRIVAVGGTLGSAVGIATSQQLLPFSTRFIIFNVQYNDFPTFIFFLIVNAIACAYFAFSIPLSILHISRSRAKNSRVVLIFMDTVMLGLLTSAASAAADIIYLAHSGNDSANWQAICNQYTDFCQQSSGSLIGSFGGVVILAVLIMMSTVALSRL